LPVRLLPRVPVLPEAPPVLVRHSGVEHAVQLVGVSSVKRQVSRKIEDVLLELGELARRWCNCEVATVPRSSGS
jgi:hypothetical protein